MKKTAINIFYPDLQKISLLTIMIIGSSFWSMNQKNAGKVLLYAEKGMPFPYLSYSDYVKGGHCPQATICFRSNIIELFPLGIIIDLLFYYLLSCFILAVIRKIINYSTK